MRPSSALLTRFRCESAQTGRDTSRASDDVCEESRHCEASNSLSSGSRLQRLSRGGYTSDPMPGSTCEQRTTARSEPW